MELTIAPKFPSDYPNIFSGITTLYNGLRETTVRGTNTIIWLSTT